MATDSTGRRTVGDFPHFLFPFVPELFNFNQVLMFRTKCQNHVVNGYIWFFSEKKIVEKLCLVRKKDKLIFRREKEYEELFEFRSFFKAGRSHLSHPHLLSNMKYKKYFAIMYILLSKTSSWKRKKKSKVLLLFTTIYRRMYLVSMSK